MAHKDQAVCEDGGCSWIMRLSVLNQNVLGRLGPFYHPSYAKDGWGGVGKKTVTIYTLPHFWNIKPCEFIICLKKKKLNMFC